MRQRPKEGHKDVRQRGNKSRTLSLASPAGDASGNIEANELGRSAPERCGYIAAADGRYRGRDPFCNAPAVPGTSYCARHLARCRVRPQSARGRALAAALRRAAAATPEPPAALPFLHRVACAEGIAEDKRELLALLDHPPPAADEPE